MRKKIFEFIRPVVQEEMAYAEVNNKRQNKHQAKKYHFQPIKCTCCYKHTLSAIARPADVYYNHCVSPSVCLSVSGQLVKMLITLEPRGIFGSKFCLLTF